MKPPEDILPDVRDGLTREERVVLYVLHETLKERGGTAYVRHSTDMSLLTDSIPIPC